MTIIQEIAILGRESINQIEALQDFHVFTGYSYDRFRKMVEAGHVLGTVTNARTQTNVQVTELAETLLVYLDNDLPRVILYQAVSNFETFFFTFLSLLLTNNAHPLARNRQVSVDEVLGHPTKDSLVSALIDRELHEVQYKNVQGWFAYLARVMKIPDVDDAQIGRLAEAKASRDVLAHNAGVANEIYRHKSGHLARAGVGEPLPVTRLYVYDTSDFLKDLISRLTKGAVDRLDS